MPNDDDIGLGLTTTLFQNFINNFLLCFRLIFLPLHLLGILLTLALVKFGIDWQFYVSTSGSKFKMYFFMSLIIGAILPIIVPIILLFYGKLIKNKKIVIAGATIIQAATIGLLLSFFYKSLTGRVPPDLFGTYQSIDISNGFRFGFLKGGVFWGWPSSHTSVAFAIAVALINLFPKNRLVQVISLLFAFYVGLGVAIVGAHWLSDFVAGIIYGSIAGFIVGKSYLKVLSKYKLQYIGNLD